MNKWGGPLREVVKREWVDDYRISLETLSCGHTRYDLRDDPLPRRYCQECATDSTEVEQ